VSKLQNKFARLAAWVAVVLAVVGTSALVSIQRAHAQAPTVNVSGIWVTQFAGAQAIVTLAQSGPHVTGTYVNSAPLSPGALAGVMRGNTLVGRWTDATTSGGFALVFGPDGRAFVGTWGRTVTNTTNGGAWNGNRQ